MSDSHEGKLQITELASQHMKAVSQAVRDSLSAIQASVDELRTMVDSTETVVLLSIENHMRVSEQALLSAQALAKQVNEFKNLVKQTLPEKETLDDLQRISTGVAGERDRPTDIVHADADLRASGRSLEADRRLRNSLVTVGKDG